MSPGRRALIGVTLVPIVLLATVPLTLANFQWVPLLLLGAWLMTTAVVGGLVMAGRPGNAVGSLMVSAGLVLALTTLFIPAYAEFALEQGRPEMPLARLAAWLTLWCTVPAFSLFIHLFLRFPTGTLPSPRWRWISRLAVLAVVCTSAGYALRPGPIDHVPSLSNPVGGLVPKWLSEAGIAIGDTLLPVMGFLAIASLFVRYRRAQPVERQQMKWFVFAVCLFPVLFLLSQAVQAIDDSQEEYLGFVVIVAGLLFVPVSMGIGILRHRLYDIDVVLNRALVYGALTGVLGATYLGGVFLIQSVAERLTKESDLAVAGSTLAVAALFRPVKRRVQDFIDRRFYRRKYDAAETLSAFAAHLRDQVDLPSLSRELVAVVGRTMQPAHASLWLRRGEPT